jgi:Protein of unknown function (DUF1236)
MARYLWIGPAAGMALFSTTALVGAQQLPGTDAPTRERVPETRPLREPPLARESQPGTKGAPANQPGADRPNDAERPHQTGPRTTDRPDQDRPRGAERPVRTRPSTAQPDADTGTPGRARVSQHERGEVAAKLRQARIEKAHVQVNLNVGARVPRSVRLHSVPATVLALAPAYRGYSYFLRDDDAIVIVDARTFVVIDVIPPGTRAAGLSLSADDMHFIFVRVPRDEVADVRIRLALGAEIPRSVQLIRFPPDVVARIPEVDRYRYVVAGDDVAVVDPRDNAVVLVIGE